MFNRCFILLFLLMIIDCSHSPSEVEFRPDTWYNVWPDSTAIFSGVFFLDSNTGWVGGATRCLENNPCAGWSTVIYRTKDGGRSWHHGLVFSETNVNGIHFFDNLNGIAIRRNVSISDDGGASWMEVTKLRGPIVRDIEFITNSGGWAAASGSEPDGAVVMKTMNGGQTWEVLTSSLRTGIGGGVYLSISVPTSKTTYATGFSIPSKGLLIRTTDSGNTWEDMPLPEDFMRYYSIDFVSESYGWLVGESRTIYRTTDGGNTWSRQFAGDGADAIYDIDAMNQNNAVAITSEGAVLLTRDGGEIWEEQAQIDSPHPLARVFYHESGTAYAAGNGVILKARINN